MQHLYPKLVFPRLEEWDPDIGVNLRDFIDANIAAYPDIFMPKLRDSFIAHPCGTHSPFNTIASCIGDVEEVTKRYELREFGLLRRLALRNVDDDDSDDESWDEVKDTLRPPHVVYSWLPLDTRVYGTDTFEYFTLRKHLSVAVTRISHWLNEADEVMRCSVTVCITPALTVVVVKQMLLKTMFPCLKN